MKFLKTNIKKAEQILKDPKATKKEKQLAKEFCALHSVSIILSAQRNHWLDAFATSTKLPMKEARKKLKEEDNFAQIVFKGKLKAKSV